MREGRKRTLARARHWSFGSLSLSLSAQEIVAAAAVAPDPRTHGGYARENDMKFFEKGGRLTGRGSLERGG